MPIDRSLDPLPVRLLRRFRGEGIFQSINCCEFVCCCSSNNVMGICRAAYIITPCKAAAEAIATLDPLPPFNHTGAACAAVVLLRGRQRDQGSAGGMGLVGGDENETHLRRAVPYGMPPGRRGPACWGESRQSAGGIIRLLGRAVVVRQGYADGMGAMRTFCHCHCPRCRRPEFGVRAARAT